MAEYIEPFDMVGKRYGNLIVKEFYEYRPKKGYREKMWLCECDCGNTFIASGRNLRAKRYISCGCLKNERIKKLKYSHGGAKHGKEERLYHIWKAMKARCTNPNNKSFPRYGGRGIDVCDEWSKSYVSFKEWAMRNGYNPNAEYSKCTIDRIDNDGNYEPNNCRWVDMKIQVNNRSISKMRGEVNVHRA